MTLFFILAASLVLACLLWLLGSLFRSRQSTTDQESVNILLARERRDTLQTALAEGAIDQATFDYEYSQLAYDLATDLRPVDNPQHTAKGGQLSAGLLIAAFIPLASGALYLHLGNPTAITEQAVAASEPQDQAPALAELLPRLEQRLASSPDDIEGWRLLGRSYLSVNQFQDAQRAFEKALALDDNDVPTLAQLAESIAMTREGDLSGAPLQYLERAIDLDPSHEHSLWLIGIARQQAGDHKAALASFDRLTAMAAGNEEALMTIEQMRSRSVAALAERSAENGSDSTASPTPGDSQTEGATLQVTVELDATARSAVAENDAVFVYAKAATGPPMPLAVSRLQVKDLPATVTLNDSMAMIPTMTLSSFPIITVGARVSPSGNPIAQQGDWYSEQTDIDLSDNPELQLTIDRQTK